jgi:hypothetical protein
VAHACNPSYSGGRDREGHGSKPAWANSREILSWQKPIIKGLSSNPCTGRKKKECKENLSKKIQLTDKNQEPNWNLELKIAATKIRNPRRGRKQRKVDEHGDGAAEAFGSHGMGMWTGPCRSAWQFHKSYSMFSESWACKLGKRYTPVSSVLA